MTITWFDYLSFGVFFYFIIRGICSGFIKTLASLIGIIVAFLYSGTLSIKLAPLLRPVTSHPALLTVLSYLLSFFLIYCTLVAIGWLIICLLKNLNLTLADRILGGFLGLFKACIFVSFLYLLFVIPYPSSKEALKKSFSYPIIHRTLTFSWQFIPQSWKDFLNQRLNNALS